MFNELMFILGLTHNLLLIAIFYSSAIKNKTLIKKFGLTYLILTIPLCVTNLILSITEKITSTYTIYLTIVLAYLSLEVILDWIIKKDFRKNWKILTPYLTLYFFTNYALIIIVWKNNITLGTILLILYITQLIFNALSHEKIRKKLLRKNK